MIGHHGRVRTRRQPPETFDDLVEIADAHRIGIAWCLAGIALLVVALPIVTWLALSIGARGRESNCAVVERTFLGYNHDITAALIAASPKPEDPAKQAASARAFEADLASRVQTRMEGCGG